MTIQLIASIVWILIFVSYTSYMYTVEMRKCKLRELEAQKKVDRIAYEIEETAKDIELTKRCLDVCDLLERLRT